MNLVTPLEPASARRRDAGAARASGRSCRTGAFERLAVAAASACGRGHEVNEDAHSEPGASTRLFVVADGVGGGAMASLASRELVSQLHATLDRGPIDADVLREALLEADAHVCRQLALKSRDAAAATLVLCARMSVSRWLVAWVGDCRAYRVGADASRPAQPLTRDDTYRLLDEPPPSGSAPDDPARMVGNGAVLSPSVAAVELAPGGMLLLCSDGLHKHVSAQEMAHALRGATATLAQCCSELAELAHERGSDDATLLVVQRERRAVPALAALAGAALLAAALAALLFDVGLLLR